MKTTILFICFLFFGISHSTAQTSLNTDGLNTLNNVYLYALKEYCKSLDSLAAKEIFVAKEIFISNNWPKKIGNFKIIYLQNKDYKKTISNNNGSIETVKISSLQFDNDNFYISVTMFGTGYRKKLVQMSNTGGLIVYFKYDPLLGGLIFKEKKWAFH